MADLVDLLHKKSESYFKEYKILSANCPNCGAPLVIKYARNPPKHYLRKLSIIIACTAECDRAIWNTDAKEGFTHWWLEGNRDKVGYEKIIDSLPSDEKKTVRELERGIRRINKDRSKINILKDPLIKEYLDSLL